MLEQILAAGWEFAEPFAEPLLQAGFQRAGEKRAPGPYLQAPGVRQEAAASLYGAPQPGGGLDPRQGGDSGQQLQAAKLIIDSALSLSDGLGSKETQVDPQTPGERAETYGITIYDDVQMEAGPEGGTLRYATYNKPDGRSGKRYLTPSEHVKNGKIHFGVSPGSPGKEGPTTVAPAATPSSGGLFAPLDTSFNMPGPAPVEKLFSPGQLSGPSTGLPSPGGVGDFDWDFDALMNWQERFDGPTGMGTALSGMGTG